MRAEAICKDCGQKLFLSSDLSPVTGEQMWRTVSGKHPSFCWPIRHDWDNRHHPEEK